MPQQPSVVVEQEGPLLHMRLNRPERRNAIDGAAATELLAALQMLEQRPDLRVGVLSGEGAGFCSGMDLDDFRASGAPPALEALYLLPRTKPLVCAVEGFAIAGGFELALLSDILVAAEDAIFALPEVRVGLVGWRGIASLATALPPQAASLIALTGARVDAPLLHSWGIVSVLAEPGTALSTAVTWALAVADQAPLAVGASRELITAAPRLGEDEFRERALLRAHALLDSQDAQEGATAFLERRPPRWKGC